MNATGIGDDRDGCRLSLYVQPRASKTAFVGIHDQALKLSLTAAPVEGQANKQVVAFLAGFFKVRKSDIRILRGESSRRKLVCVKNISAEAVRGRLRDEGIL